jgi:hypothetical protein
MSGDLVVVVSSGSSAMYQVGLAEPSYAGPIDGPPCPVEGENGSCSCILPRMSPGLLVPIARRLDWAVDLALPPMMVLRPFVGTGTGTGVAGGWYPPEWKKDS